jgi:hypothetical protein
LDPDGKKVEAYMHVLPYSESRPLGLLERHVMASTQRQPNGDFEMDGLAPGRHVIVADSNPGDAVWWNDPVLVDLSKGSIDDLVIRVEPVTQVALHPETGEARKFAWWVVASNGIVCADGSFGWPGDAKVALGAGSFRLLVGDDPEHAREIPFTVGREATTVSVGP